MNFKIIDRYIFKKYISSFLFVMFILVLVICVIDYTEKNEDFIRKNVPVRAIFIDYYLNFIPYIANLIAPIIVFIATVFVTARLAARTEIIAIINSGVSLFRILVPYVAGAMIIAVTIFYLYGWVIPKASRIRHAFENQYVRHQFFYDKKNVHIKVGPQTYVYMESYNNSIKCGYQFTLETIDLDNDIEKDKITGDRLVWQDTLHKWRIENYVKHTFNGEKETITRGEKLDTALNLSPKDFETQHMLYEQLTIDELNEHVRTLIERGSEGVEPYLIEKYERQAYPFSIIILTIIGVIVAARKSREGVGLQIAFGFLLAFIYILLALIGRSIAGVGNTITPLVSAWIPNILFSIIGIIMYFRVPK